MNARINFNGSFIDEETPLITAKNRGLRYGDGIFETMRVVNGKLRLGDLHFDRLMGGIQRLQIHFPGQIDAAYLENQVQKTVTQNKIAGAARVRLMVFRGEGGLYDTDNPANFIIECSEMAVKPLLNENGLRLGVYSDARKACDGLSNLKSNNFLPYLMAAQYAKGNDFHDCLLLNSHERICDSTIANLFWVKNRVVHTPPLTEGCVAGIMRRHLLGALPAAGYSVVEQPVTVSELEDADEIFLTNAIRGLRWVGSFNGREFSNKTGSDIFYSMIS